MKMFNDQVMDYYRHPRNRKRLEKPDFSSDESNPSCGDNVIFDGTVNDGQLSELSFEGTGCALSMASASMLTEACVGKTLDEILALDKAFIIAMLGLELGPNRMKCAILPLKALQQGVMNYREGKKP